MHLIGSSGHRVADAVWATFGQALKGVNPQFEDDAQAKRAHHQAQAQALVAKAEALGAITAGSQQLSTSTMPLLYPEHSASLIGSAFDGALMGPLLGQASSLLRSGQTANTGRANTRWADGHTYDLTKFGDTWAYARPVGR